MAARSGEKLNRMLEMGQPPLAGGFVRDDREPIWTLPHPRLFRSAAEVLDEQNKAAGSW